MLFRSGLARLSTGLTPLAPGRVRLRLLLTFAAGAGRLLSGISRARLLGCLARPLLGALIGTLFTRLGWLVLISRALFVHRLNRLLAVDGIAFAWLVVSRLTGVSIAFFVGLRLGTCGLLRRIGSRGTGAVRFLTGSLCS